MNGSFTLLDYKHILNWYPGNLRITDPENSCLAELNFLIKLTILQWKLEQSIGSFISAIDSSELDSRIRENTGVMLWTELSLLLLINHLCS